VRIVAQLDTFQLRAAAASTPNTGGGKGCFAGDEEPTARTPSIASHSAQRAVRHLRLSSVGRSPESLLTIGRGTTLTRTLYGRSSAARHREYSCTRLGRGIDASRWLPPDRSTLPMLTISRTCAPSSPGDFAAGQDNTFIRCDPHRSKVVREICTASFSEVYQVLAHPALCADIPPPHSSPDVMRLKIAHESRRPPFCGRLVGKSPHTGAPRRPCPGAIALATGSSDSASPKPGSRWGCPCTATTRAQAGQVKRISRPIPRDRTLTQAILFSKPFRPFRDPPYSLGRSLQVPGAQTI